MKQALAASSKVLPLPLPPLSSMLGKPSCIPTPKKLLGTVPKACNRGGTDDEIFSSKGKALQQQQEGYRGSEGLPQGRS